MAITFSSWIRRYCCHCVWENDGHLPWKRWGSLYSTDTKLSYRTLQTPSDHRPWPKSFRMLFHNILFLSYPILSANADRYFRVSSDYLETFPRIWQLNISYRSLLLSECAIFSCLPGKLHFHMLQILGFQIYFPCWNEKPFHLKNFTHKHDYSEEKKKNPNNTEENLPPYLKKTPHFKPLPFI